MIRRTFSWVRFFFAIGIAFFPFFVSAGTVGNLIDQPSTMQVSVGSNHKFTFTTTSLISEGSTLSIVFPAGFDLSALGEDDVDITDDGVDLSTSSDCSGSDQMSVGFTGQTVLMTVCSGDGGAIASSSIVTIEIGTNAAAFGLGTHRITNPSAVTTYFVNLTETGGNSGSVLLKTTNTGSSAVTATVPASGGSDSGGGSGSGGSPSTPDDPEPDPEEPEVPVDDPEAPEVPETPVEPSETPEEDPSETPEDSGSDDAGDPSDSGGDHGDSDSSVPSGSDTGSDVDTETTDESSGGSGATPDDDIDVTEEEGTEELPTSSGGSHTVNEETTPVSPEPGTVKPPKTPTPPAYASVVTVFTESIQVVAERLEEIRALPEVQTAVDVAIPVTIATAVSTTAVLATSFNLLTYLQFMFTSPLLLIARRKRKAFGVVYNSATKVAIDLAIVRLYNATTNRLVKSMVTDAEGKYFFVVDPGKYRVTVTKTGFIFPSTDLAGVKDDGVFLDVYTGQIIEVTQRDATIAANIPLDIAQGQKAQEPKGIMRKRFLRKLQFVLSFSGSFLSMLVYVFSPSFLTLGLAIGQIVVFFVIRRLARQKKPRGWGVVYDTLTHRPVGNAVVRLFEPKYNKLVETTLTDTLGRYSFLVGPNEYFVSTNREGYDERIIRPIDFREKREPEPLAIDVPLDPKTS